MRRQQQTFQIAVTTVQIFQFNNDPFWQAFKFGQGSRTSWPILAFDSLPDYLQLRVRVWMKLWNNTLHYVAVHLVNFVHKIRPMSKILFITSINSMQHTRFVTETGGRQFSPVGVALHDHHVRRLDRGPNISCLAPDPVIAGAIHADVDAAPSDGCGQDLGPYVGIRLS